MEITCRGQQILIYLFSSNDIHVPVQARWRWLGSQYTSPSVILNYYSRIPVPWNSNMDGWRQWINKHQRLWQSHKSIGWAGRGMDPLHPPPPPPLILCGLFAIAFTTFKPWHQIHKFKPQKNSRCIAKLPTPYPNTHETW